MSVHKLEIVANGGELRLELRCTAVKGADCRQRPLDDRESWNVGDPGLVDGDCWAVDYIAAGGFSDSVFMYEDGVVASVAVNVDYEEAVNLSLALDDIPLAGLEPHDSGESDPTPNNETKTAEFAESIAQENAEVQL